jgi:hypothetical protein
MAARTGIASPAEQEEIGRKAAAARARAAADMPPQEFGRRNGITHELAIFLQRLEARVLELESRVAALEAAQKNSMPRHLANVERRAS